VVACASFGRVAPAGGETTDDATHLDLQGTHLEHAPTHPTAASSVVRGTELEAVGQSSADVLARIPGVAVQRTGAASELATAAIRGSDSNQVPIYVAGIRVNDDVSGTADLSTVPLWMMDRVEVFRGNAPANADQLGLGGAIFFWPRLPRTTRVGAGAEVGSFGARGGFVAGEVGNERAGALVAVRHDSADTDYGYVNDQGLRFDRDDRNEKRRNADYSATDAWAIGRYRLSRTDTVSTVVNAYQREQGVTGLAVVPAERARGTTRRLLSGISGRFGCPGHEDDCHLDVQASFLGARAVFTDPLLELPSLRTSLLANSGKRGPVRAGIDVNASSWLGFGGSVSQTLESIDVERLGLPSREGNRSATHVAATATVTPLPALHLFGLGALDCQTTSGVDDQFGTVTRKDGDTCGVLEPAGRLGVGYGVSRDVELVANVGHYVRVPTLSELYGSSPLVQGNSSLRPEMGETVDAGVRASTSGAAGRYALDAFAFARRADDLVRYRRTSLGSAGPYNVGHARILGVEGAASAEWWRALRATATATLMDPKDTTPRGVDNPTTNDVLPLMSRLAFSARVEAFTERGLSLLKQDRATVALVYLHRSSRFSDPAGQVVLPEQDFVDLEVTSTHLDGKVLLRLAVRNVLGSHQLDLLGLPLPGRSAYAELEAFW
jgi:vitamin B12 transporter